MSNRSDYSDVQWYALWKPLANVPTAVMVAHPSHLTREAFAAHSGLERAADSCREPLVAQLFAPSRDEAEWLSHWLDIERRDRGATNTVHFMSKALHEVRAALSLLHSIGTEAEAQEYAQRLFDVALTVAKAGKEGEIFGFDGVRLDESERVFLRDLADALGLKWDESGS